MRKKKKTQKRVRPDLGTVRKVASSVELTDVLLYDSEVSRTDRPIPRKAVKIQIDSVGEVSTVDNDGKTFVVSAKFGLLASEKEGPEVFHVNSSFNLLYKVTSQEPFNKDELGEFARTNGVFNAWPYFREFVQSMSVRMGYPPITVPVFRLPKT